MYVAGENSCEVESGKLAFCDFKHLVKKCRFDDWFACQEPQVFAKETAAIYNRVGLKIGVHDFVVGMGGLGTAEMDEAVAG